MFKSGKKGRSMQRMLWGFKKFLRVKEEENATL